METILSALGISLIQEKKVKLKFCSKETYGVPFSNLFFRNAVKDKPQ